MQTNKDVESCNSKLNDNLPVVSSFYFIVLAVLVYSSMILAVLVKEVEKQFSAAQLDYAT